MFKCLLVSAVVVSLIFAPQASALSVAENQAAVEAYIDSIVVAVKAAAEECLLGKEDCYTGWSCQPSTQCNNTLAAPTTCTTAVDDLGLPDQCGAYSGQRTVTQLLGAAPATPALTCFRITVYSGKGGRGFWIDYTIKQANAWKIKRRAWGPQKDSLAHGFIDYTP